jgi:hypothetical protein
MRWEQSRRESRGIPIDLHEEGRIEFLLEIACAQESTKYCDIANDAVDRLISSWDRESPDFNCIMDIIRKVASSDWLVTHGGRQMCRKILDQLLAYLEVALASDWTELLALPEIAPGWTEADTVRLHSALGEYEESGVRDEISNCSTVDEMQELVSYLEELNSKVGGDFAYWVRSLQGDIAERNEREDCGESYYPRPLARAYMVPAPSPSPRESPRIIQRAVFGDDDARQLFATLNPEK